LRYLCEEDELQLSRSCLLLAALFVAPPADAADADRASG
jgi:hypothetical protein